MYMLERKEPKPSMQSTYEELKQLKCKFYNLSFRRMQSYLWGIETLSSTK